MAYIGRGTDKISNVEVLDNITFDGSSSYSITKSSVAFTPNSAQSLLISIDGVVQATNFTVSSSTIDFGVAIPSTSTCDFILHYGIGLITTPSDGTVTTAKLADSSVSLAKLTATGTKDATTFLRGDNTFAEVPAGGITEADQWRVTATGTGTGVFTSNWERNDTNFDYIGTGMSESSGIFTFPSTGIYKIDFQATGKNNVQTDYVSYKIETTTDNSTYTTASQQYAACNTGNSFCNFYMSVIFDVTNTSTHKVRFNHDQNEAGTFEKSSSTTAQITGATFIRLGDT